MLKSITIFSFACLSFLLILNSCHAGKKSTAHSSHKPKFMDDIYMDKHNKNNVTVNGIQNTEIPVANNTKQQSNTTTRHNEDIKPSEVNSLKTKYADILGVKTKDITNYSLYQFIDEWYGVNYRMGGNDKSGIDCSSFARKLITEVYGLDLDRTACDQYNNCAHIKNVKTASEGDLVFFHIHSKRVSHVGVYLKNDYFVHASSSGGVMISNLNDEYWRKYFAGAGKVVKD